MLGKRKELDERKENTHNQMARVIRNYVSETSFNSYRFSQWHDLIWDNPLTLPSPRRARESNMSLRAVGVVIPSNIKKFVGWVQLTTHNFNNEIVMSLTLLTMT